MVRTSAPNSVAGLFVDENPGGPTIGTEIVAADQNNHQEEIANAVEGAGLTLSGADDGQLLKAIVALSHAIGEPVFNVLEKAPSVTFPAVRVDDADHDITTTHWPDLVTALRAHKLKSDATTDHSVTVAGSVITFPSNQAADRLLAALDEDKLVHGGYTNWLAVNVAATDYAITNVNPGARTVTVTGTPASGAQTAIVYPYRVAGAATTARLRKIGGRALVSHTDGIGESIAGLRRRDRAQGHWHQLHNTAGAAASSLTVERAGDGVAAGVKMVGTNATNSSSQTLTVENPITDSTNGTPRVGTTTDPRSFSAYLYLWGARYIP